MHNRIFASVVCLAVVGCSPESAQSREAVDSADETYDPILDQPFPDPATNSKGLTRVGEQLSTVGGADSDRSVFVRFLRTSMVKIMANGGRAIETPETVRDALDEQRRMEAAEVQTKEENNVATARRLCEVQRNYPKSQNLIRVSIGGKTYTDPCAALRENGLIGAAVAAAPPHPCLGDFVYKGPTDGISVGVRVRSSPDHAEILFSDYGNINSPSVSWNDGAIRITDQQDGSDIVVVCSADEATLILPADQWNSARTFKLRRTNGSLWEVGAREGWLEPAD